MTFSPYNTLILFEKAFHQSGIAGALINIDSSAGTTVAAEGERRGIAWRVEADVHQKLAIDQEQLKQAYLHLGEHLLPHCYAQAIHFVNTLGYRGEDAERQARKAIEPVLDAMQFNMGWAADSKWFGANAAAGYSTKTFKANEISLQQAFDWTRVERGRWTSMDLMTMLFRLDGRNYHLTKEMGEVWLDAHPAKHREVAKRVLDTSFVMDVSGHLSGMIDPKDATSAWKDWWRVLPSTPLQATPLAHLVDCSPSKVTCLLTGWYQQTAQSKKMCDLFLADMGLPKHHCVSTLDWIKFSNALRHILPSHTDIVWKDKNAQAWLLHRCLGDDAVPERYPVLQNNKVHEYVQMSKELMPTCKMHERYSFWQAQQTQSNTMDACMDMGALFDVAP